MLEAKTRDFQSFAIEKISKFLKNQKLISLFFWFCHEFNLFFSLEKIFFQHNTNSFEL